MFGLVRVDRKSNNVSVTFKVSKMDYAFRYTGYNTHKKDQKKHETVMRYTSYK